MKKFSTRLFSLLAVFCLVFFCFPLVSFASTHFRIELNYWTEQQYIGGNICDITSNVDGIGIIQKSDSSFSAFIYFKTKPSSLSVKDGSGHEYKHEGNVDFNSSLGYFYIELYNYGWYPLKNFVSAEGFKYVGPPLSNLKAYLDANIDSTDPITPSLDSGLGSFVLGSNNAWANRIYGNNEYVGSFMTILRDTTTTGKKWGTDFDTLQYYTGVDHFTKLRVIGNNEDLGSFMSDKISIASSSQLTNGRGGHHFTVSCPEDFRKPMASALEKGGQGSYQQIYDGINAFFTQLINNNSYSFKPVIVVRPYNSKTGAYGNWLRVTSGTISKSTLNSSQNGSSLIGTSSDDSLDPTIKEPSGSLENKGVVSSGDTLDNAINNSYSVAPITNVDPSIVNNNYPDFYNQPEFQNSPSFSNNPNIVVTQSGIVSGGNNSVVINNDNNVSNNLENINQAIQGDSSGNDVKGSVLSNIFGLLGMITAVPKMLSILFGWLPSWALTCAGVAFALIIPLIIYKILRG